MFKKLFMVLVVLLSAQIPLTYSQEGESVTIVFVPGSSSDPFYIGLQSGILQALADAEVNVQFTTENPTDSQIDLLERIVARGDVDYLLVAPTDSQQLISVLERAFQAGIEVITIGTPIGDGDYTSGSVTFPLTHIGSNSYLVGFTACQALDLPAGAQIYIQTGDGADQRLEGCEAAVQDLNVITAASPAHDVPTAQAQTLAALNQYPDLAGIFGTDSIATYGAGLAVQQTQRSIPVVGIDTTSATVDLLHTGIITALVAQKPFEMGYWAGALAVAHAMGYESIPKRFTIDSLLITADTHPIPIYVDSIQPPAPPLTDLTIGFVPGVKRDPPDPFYVTLGLGVEAAVETYGVQLVTEAPAHFNPEDQIPAIENLIAEHAIDYLIAAPTDRNALIPILEQIHDQGIPIITVDTFIGDGDYAAGSVTFPLTYIGSDNVRGGYLGCSQLAMADILGTGAKIYIQNVRPGISTTDQRAEGCLAAAADFGLDVVAMDYSDNVVEDGTAQTIQILAEHPDIVGIFGTNVFSAQGAGAAVQEVGLGGIVEVVAFDSTEFAINLLHSGTVTQVIAQKPADIGYFAVLSAVADARGIQSIPKRWSTGYEVINLNNVSNPDIARFIYRED
jgi:ribose transport system substrate-binding protein